MTFDRFCSHRVCMVIHAHNYIDCETSVLCWHVVSAHCFLEICIHGGRNFYHNIECGLWNYVRTRMYMYVRAFTSFRKC